MKKKGDLINDNIEYEENLERLDITYRKLNTDANKIIRNIIKENEVLIYDLLLPNYDEKIKIKEFNEKEINEIISRLKK